MAASRQYQSYAQWPAPHWASTDTGLDMLCHGTTSVTTVNNNPSEGHSEAGMVSVVSVVAGLIWLLLAAHCGRGCAGPACRAAATGPSVGPANLPYNTSTTTHRHQWYSVTLPTLSTSLTTLQTHITYNNTHWYFLPLPTTNYVPTITIPHNITNITVHSVVLCNTTSLPEKTNHRYQCYSLKQRVRKDFKMDFLKPSLTIVTSLDRWKLLYNFTILL